SFAERVVAPAANLVPLPDGVDLFSAALTEPLSVARHALGPEQAASVAVIGSGGIGLGAIVIARARGARRVLAIDVSATALGHAEACGAETLLVGEPIESAAFEQVLECTGAPGTLGLAAELAAPGGEVAMVGIGGGEDFPAEAFVRNELRARGAFAYLYEEVVEVAQGISAGDLSVGGIGPEAAPLAEIMAAVERLRAEPGAHPRIIVQPRDGVRAPAQVRR
ncbi:MAG TPA: zinc-binding dehydrogenase, partial [Solirubrobacterales bacterium]|nr:zinc-binding dehydrogenase [Solirubrobacterales bacterium]